MPCLEAERDQIAPSDDPPRTPTKSTGNDGAGADDQNGSTESENSSDDGLAGAKHKRKRPNAEYILMKRWVTGDEAEMEEEDIENEMKNVALWLLLDSVVEFVHPQDILCVQESSGGKIQCCSTAAAATLVCAPYLF